MFPCAGGVRRLTVGTALVLVGLAAGDSFADNRGVPLRLGDTVTGEVGPLAGDADDFLVDLTEGELVDAQAMAPRGSLFTPYIRFFEPSGIQALDVANFSSGADTPKFKVKKYPVPATGRWIVRIVGGTAEGATGTYSLKVKAKAPKKAVNKGESLGDAEVADYPFGGYEDGTVSVTIKDVSGPQILVGDVEILGPSGDPLPGLAPLLLRKGTSIKAKKVPLTDGFGEYVLRITGPAAGGPSVVDVTIQVKNPKLDAASSNLSSTEPRVTQVNPSKAPAGGNLTVIGTGFAPGAIVWMKDTPATNVVVNGPTNISCKSPAGDDADAGLKVRVSVQNPDGQENGKDNAFEYASAPNPSSFLPTVGPTAGGATVTIYGTGFRTGAAGYSVTFGGLAASDVIVTSTTQIQCKCPPSAPGPVTVSVTDEFAQGADLPGTYLYVVPPVLTNVSPDSGPASGGTLVTLTGSGFRAATRVYFGAKQQTPVTLIDSNTLEITTDQGTGLVDVKVIDEFNDFDLIEDAFRFESKIYDATAGIPAQPGRTSPAGWDVAVGDLDGDGDKDVVLSDDFSFNYNNYSTFTYSALHVLKNDGGLNFSDASLASLPLPRFWAYYYVSDRSWQGESVSLGDLDGDSDLDMVVSRRNSFSAYPYYTYNGVFFYYIYTSGTRVLMNNGSGTFTLPTPNLTPYYYSAGVGNNYGYSYYNTVVDRWQADRNLLGDLNGDGNQDLVLVSRHHPVHVVVSGYYYYANPAGSSAARVLLGVGDGSFVYYYGAVPWTYTNTYGFPYLDDFNGTDAQLGDLDGDGSLDLVISHRSLRPSYSYPTSYPYGYGSNYMIGTRVLLNGGSGLFYFSYVNMPVTHGYMAGSYDFLQADCVRLGDLDGDGSLDMVLASPYPFYYYDSYLMATYYRPSVRVLLNNGSGAFSDITTSAWGGPFSYNPGISAPEARIGDVDGDGANDIVLVTPYSYYVSDGYSSVVTGTRFFLNDGSASFSLAPMSFWSDMSEAAGQGIRWTGRTAFLGDLDGDTDLDVLTAHSYNYYVYGAWYSMLLEQK
jgi:hypothetical protein